MPSAISNDEIHDILHRAMASPIGIIVDTNDVVRARARMYKVRAESMAEFAKLQFRIWPEGSGQIAIVRGG